MATEGGGELNLSEECFDVNCTTCSRDNLVKQAVKYCADCKKNLCIICLQGHNRYIDGHTLIDMKDADQGSVLTEKCGKHTDEVIKLLCLDHDELVCSLCAMLDHRKCQELKLIADCLDKLEKDRNLTKVPKQMKSALQNVEKVITALDQHMDKLSKQEQEILDEIEEHTNKILAKIKQMKSDAKKDVSTKHGELASSATKKRHICLVMKKDISMNLENMKASKDKRSHLFVLMKKGQVLTNNVEKLCRESAKLMTESQLSLSLDMRIDACLNDVTSLATVGDKVRVKQNGEKYRATMKSSIGVSVKGDRETTCNILDCCLLPDGTVLLVDTSNQRLKLVDPSTSTIIDHCDMKEHIWGVTLINSHEALVSTGSNILQVVSLGNKIIHGKLPHLFVRHGCVKLALSQGELYITYNDTVYVNKVSWRQLRTICKDKSGQKMFTGIQDIAVNVTGDMVFVTDFNNGLVCVDRDGQMRFRCSEQELGLTEINGVCTDNDGNVFVCGYKSNNVVQVSEDGTVLGEILTKTDGVNKPKCLCFDRATDTMCVGGYMSKLLMFKLQ